VSEVNLDPDDDFFDLPGDVLENEDETPEHDDGDA
jgi:hypothetical protein